MGATAIKAALERAKIPPEKVSEVLIGQVLTAGAGQNPARQAAMKAGIPKEIPSTGVNMLCGSGLRTVVMGYQAIRNGDATESMVVCWWTGKHESGMIIRTMTHSLTHSSTHSLIHSLIHSTHSSIHSLIQLLTHPPTHSSFLSQAPHSVHMRSGVKFGDTTLTDTMLKDGLTDAFQNCHMGITAENVAKQHSISRSEQDQFATSSQNKTETSQKAGFFRNEIVPVNITTRKGAV